MEKPPGPNNSYPQGRRGVRETVGMHAQGCALSVVPSEAAHCREIDFTDLVQTQHYTNKWANKKSREINTRAATISYLNPPVFNKNH